MVETVGLVRPRSGGKRSIAARYVISISRPVYATKATRTGYKAKRRGFRPFVLLCDLRAVAVMVETVGLEPTTSCM